MFENLDTNYELDRTLRAHALPLTNCVLTKSGNNFATGSYDRLCKVWDTATGKELLTLQGHQNVVYALAYNNPFGYDLQIFLKVDFHS